MARKANKVRKTCKKWTEEEEQVIIDELIKNPENITECFFEVSKKIDRTPGAINNHWYTVVSRKPGVNVYGTLSHNNYARNRKLGQGVKNKKGKRGVPITPSFWNRFINMIKKYL